jgi:hypothetical protein
MPFVTMPQTQALQEYPEIAASYDLIAVQPMTERALKQVGLSIL